MVLGDIVNGIYWKFVNNPIRIKITEILQIEFMNNKFAFLSLWSLLHFISGFSLGFFINKMSWVKSKSESYKFLLILILLICFEFFEWWLMGALPELFIPETYLDAFWDVIIGFIGFLTSLFLINKIYKE